jgi:hypothetical protein
MSADNGIYIGIFPEQDGKEYRVIHAQAIENLNFDPDTDDGFNSLWVCMLYAQAPEFFSYSDAMNHVFEIEREIMSSMCPVIEYGIVDIDFQYPFEWYVRKLAEKVRGF